jgi:fibrillarin-like pre-rRNA processing protein
MELIKKFPNVYVDRKGRFTDYYVAGSSKTYFDEFVKKDKTGTYRRVDPERSKLFAAIAKGISQIGIKVDSSVLYLGASHGYTVSFLSDVVKNGKIFALDFAPRVMRDLVVISEDKENIAPIFADANKVEEFDQIGKVDVVFMDIAQRDQVRIFLKNCNHFLEQGGFGLLALKARSVDVTKKPKEIFKLVRAELEKNVTVVDYRELAPYEKDHAFFVVKKK